MNNNNYLFCDRPFSWIDITTIERKGNCYLCCPAWLNKPIGNLYSQSLNDVWNSEAAIEIRESILDGSFRFCNSSLCPFYINQRYPVYSIDEDLLKSKITKLSFGPKIINFAYDRSCNLFCPSCRTQIEIENANKDVILEINEKIKNQLLPQAEFINLCGMGDPFGSPFMKKWLCSLNFKDIENLKAIYMQTNGMLFTSNNWNAIDKDVRAKIYMVEISIDAATEETYNLNRPGGNFKKLLENLKFISELRKQKQIQRVDISMVVQKNNYQEMKSFVELGLSYNFDSIYFSKIINWDTFSDEDIKYRRVFDRNHPEYKEFLNELNDDIFQLEQVNLGNFLSDNRIKYRCNKGKK